MLDRFSERARRVLFHARAAVGRLGSTSVRPEHIILGILDEADSLASRILARTVGPSDQLRGDVTRLLTVSDAIPDSDDVPFSPDAIRALHQATEEASALGDEGVGTEHLLLGVLRGDDGAAQLLASRGLRVDAIRRMIVTSRGSGEPPGSPPAPANLYRWPQIPFAPSRTVHILRSGMPALQPPCVNHAAHVFSAYGFTLADIAAQAWTHNRWHVDLTQELNDPTRFDFLLVLPQEEPLDACYGLVRAAVEAHFGVAVVVEPRPREVFVLQDTGTRRNMLRRHPELPHGSSSALLSFATFRRRAAADPVFPIEPFVVHSMPFFLLVRWFEEILGGQIVDEARLPGLYGFELQRPVATLEAFVDQLRAEAGLMVTRERREMPTLIVRPRSSAARGPSAVSRLS